MTIINNKYAHIIFDWDGTLMDSTGRIVSAMQSTAKKLELNIPSVSEVKAIIGLSMEDVLNQLFSEADNDMREKILAEYRYQYVDGDQTPSPLFPKSLELVHWLKQKKVTVSVATGKARHGLKRVMKEVDVEHLFDHSICADEAQSKPHPEMVERLLTLSGHDKSEALVIGDSIHDLKMAKNAGVDSIAVTSGANDKETLALHSPVAILERICFFQSWVDNNQ